ncbi:MAG: 5-(carboxyamino)imidazole ribonucleotide synthase [Gemmatimonadota bacterium]
MTVGILGGGQLGRMLALAGIPLGLDFVFLDPSPDAPAAHLGRLITAPYDDPEALREFAAAADVITYEFENVPARTADLLAASAPVWPPAAALTVAQDRLQEKRLFTRLEIATAPFEPVDSPAGTRAAAERLAGACVLKTRKHGYDGKGQARIAEPAAAAAAFAALGGEPCILETAIAFSRELSVIAARGRDGDTVVYPLVENRHTEGILRRSVAPAPGTDAVFGQALECVHDILRELDYVGVLAVELFEVDGALMANEMAPRVHNSGHWTIEGAETSQFENHLRAVVGLPLGPIDPRGVSVMLNLIGSPPDVDAVAAVPGAHIHLYGKAPRPGRKVGHVTVRADDESGLQAALSRLEGVIPEG